MSPVWGKFWCVLGSASICPSPHHHNSPGRKIPCSPPHPHGHRWVFTTQLPLLAPSRRGNPELQGGGGGDDELGGGAGARFPSPRHHFWAEPARREPHGRPSPAALQPRLLHPGQPRGPAEPRPRSLPELHVVGHRGRLVRAQRGGTSIEAPPGFRGASTPSFCLVSAASTCTSPRITSATGRTA